MVLVDAQIELPQNFGQQTATDRPAPVVGDDGDPPGGIAEDAEAPFAPNPSEACRFGRCAMVGEGNRVEFDVGQTLIHPQLTLYGSWVTSLGHMEKLVAWELKPEITVTHRFDLEDAAEASRVADEGQSGKVVLVMA